MISELNAISYCCEDIKNIENYEEAVSDQSVLWVCHHKKEIELMLSSEQLIRQHLYYERPACELIFMKPGDHSRLHNLNLTPERIKKQKEGCRKRPPVSDERRKKQSQYMLNKYATGELVPWNKGKPMSDELKEKMIAMKRTPEARAKASQYKKDWWKARRQQNK